MADKKISALTAATTPLAGTEVLPIVQSGATVKVSVANLTAGRAVAMAGGSFTDNITQSTAAKGINFTANTGAAGMTSQLLNWYEEGTWTPTFTGNGTTGTVTTSALYATYTRVGRVVSVQMTAILTVTVAPTGYLIITLPFSRKANTSFCGAVATYNVDLPAGAISINALPISVTSSQDTFVLFCSTDAGVGGLVQANTLATGNEINVGFSYIAA